MRINVGCGALVMEGFVNVDSYAGPGVDVVHDLDVHPWPFEDGTVDEVVALDVYEHVDDPLGFMSEVWRVCREGAKVRIRTTWWKSENSFRDPTHKRFLTPQSFDYWVPGTELHARYGGAYSRGRHFMLDVARVDGQELEFRLVRSGSCSGAC